MLVLNIVPPVGAEAWAPPSGNYLALATDSVVLYDEETQTVPPSPDAVVPYECPNGGFASPTAYGRCGNCGYIPSQAGWRLATTQYRYGRCVLVDVVPPLLEPMGVVTMRADVRLFDADSSSQWGYNAYVETTTGGVLTGPKVQVTGPTACGAQDVGSEGTVFYCSLLPRQEDLRTYRSGTGTTLCLYLQILKDFESETIENVDSEVIGCVVA